MSFFFGTRAVKWNDAISQQFAVGRGVRQGNCLSPDIFERLYFRAKKLRLPIEHKNLNLRRGRLR